MQSGVLVISMVSCSVCCCPICRQNCRQKRESEAIIEGAFIHYMSSLIAHVFGDLSRIRLD
jgi:hypothetical protein